MVSQFHSTSFSLSPMLSPTSTETLTHTLTCTPAHLPPSYCHQTLAHSQTLFECQICFFRFCSLKYWHMSHLSQLSTPPRQTRAFCLLVHINSRTPVFTKCLFNGNCFVSSLSDCLIAPVLLQVTGRPKDVWHRKAERRTKTNNTHICTQAHTRKHCTFLPHWVFSKSRSICN